MTQVKAAGPDYFTWEPSAAAKTASPARTAGKEKPTKPKHHKHKHRRDAAAGH